VSLIAPAPGPAVRVVRSLGTVPRSARDLARRLRPWLRREAWTRENLQAALRAARERPRRTLGILAAIVAAGVLLGQIARSPLGGLPTALVQEGPFKVQVVEAGTLQALRSVTYASSIQSNQAKIIALAPEGKMVKKGDLLILFDAAPFEEEIRKSQAQLAQAQADLDKARQDLKLQAIQNQEEVAAARQKVTRSDLELRDIQQGKGLVKEEEAVAAVASAERDLQKAQTSHDDLKPLLAEGFITKMELEHAQQQVQQAAEQLALAKRRQDALVKFGRPLEVSQAEADASMTKDSLRQLQSAAAFRVEQKRSAIASAESRILEADRKSVV
jgi:multidrug efflux pump subunit AcrA (membrane-fusion protein)